MDYILEFTYRNGRIWRYGAFDSKDSAIVCGFLVSDHIFDREPCFRVVKNGTVIYSTVH